MELRKSSDGLYWNYPFLRFFDVEKKVACSTLEDKATIRHGTRSGRRWNGIIKQCRVFFFDKGRLTKQQKTAKLA
jgi:hypothetical protein